MGCRPRSPASWGASLPCSAGTTSSRKCCLWGSPPRAVPTQWAGDKADGEAEGERYRAWPAVTWWGSVVLCTFQEARMNMGPEVSAVGPQQATCRKSLRESACRASARAHAGPPQDAQRARPEPRLPTLQGHPSSWRLRGRESVSQAAWALCVPSPRCLVFLHCPAAPGPVPVCLGLAGGLLCPPPRERRGESWSEASLPVTVGPCLPRRGSVQAPGFGRPARASGPGLAL